MHRLGRLGIVCPSTHLWTRHATLQVPSGVHRRNQMTKPVLWKMEVAMRFKARQCLSLFFSLFLFSCLPVFAQSNAESRAQLFIRYEHGASPNRIGEDLLTLTQSVRSE